MFFVAILDPPFWISKYSWQIQRFKVTVPLRELGLKQYFWGWKSYLYPTFLRKNISYISSCHGGITSPILVYLVVVHHDAHLHHETTLNIFSKKPLIWVLFKRSMQNYLNKNRLLTKESIKFSKVDFSWFLTFFCSFLQLWRTKTLQIVLAPYKELISGTFMIVFRLVPHTFVFLNDPNVHGM